MTRGLGRPLFAGGLVALGMLDLVYRDTIMWKVLPPAAPARAGLAMVSGLLLLAAGAGLFFQRFRAGAAGTLLAFLLLWDLIIGIPPLFTAPGKEVFWLIFGMMTIVVVTAWLLTGRARPGAARTVIGLALIPVGLSHFFYVQATLDLVPAWMPARSFWVYLVGAAHLAAGLGLATGVLPRLSAMLEAGMLLAFAILVWVPRVVATPGRHFFWTELLGTWVLGAALWVVADQYGGARWLSVRGASGR